MSRVSLARSVMWPPMPVSSTPPDRMGAFGPLPLRTTVLTTRPIRVLWVPPEMLSWSLALTRLSMNICEPDTRLTSEPASRDSMTPYTCIWPVVLTRRLLSRSSAQALLNTALLTMLLARERLMPAPLASWPACMMTVPLAARKAPDATMAPVPTSTRWPPMTMPRSARMSSVASRPVQLSVLATKSWLPPACTCPTSCMLAALSLMVLSSAWLNRLASAASTSEAPARNSSRRSASSTTPRGVKSPGTGCTLPSRMLPCVSTVRRWPAAPVVMPVLNISTLPPAFSSSEPARFIWPDTDMPWVALTRIS